MQAMSDLFKPFENRWFSLRAIFFHIVLPWLVITLPACMIALSGSDPQAQRKRLVLVVFFSVYFLVVRCGVFLMARDLHLSLKTDFKDRYFDKIKNLDGFGLLGLKLGATLARIKANLILEDESRRKRL